MVDKRKMFFKMIFSSVLRRKSRMLIAILAIAIGSTIISALMSIYYDIPKQMGKSFRSYGANLIFTPKDDLIEKEDLNYIKESLKDKQVIGLSSYRYINQKINESPVVMALGNFDDIQKSSPYWYISGSYPKEKDEIVVGKEVADKLNLILGQEIIFKNEKDEDINLKISAILQTGRGEEELVFIDNEVAKKVFLVDDKVNVVEVSVVSSLDELNKFIENFHNYKLKPRLVKRVTESEKAVLSKLQSLVYLVAIIVLSLTMISVATTMMASVLERKKEVALKKAIGALNKQIITEFLAESIILAVIGSILGIILGYLFALFVAKAVFNYSITMQPLIIIITFIISVGITAIASIIPVRKTSEIEPAIVLKGE